MTVMKVLTLKQPWASAVLDLGKDVENRRWSTKYRGMVAVHASLGYDRDARFPYGHPLPDNWGAPLPKGAIIAIARLVDVHPSIEAFRLDCSDWGEQDSEVFHFHFAGAVPIVPYPWSGAQGLRSLPAEVADELSRRVLENQSNP